MVAMHHMWFPSIWNMAIVTKEFLILFNFNLLKCRQLPGACGYQTGQHRMGHKAESRTEAMMQLNNTWKSLGKFLQVLTPILHLRQVCVWGKYLHSLRFLGWYELCYSKMWTFPSLIANPYQSGTCEHYKWLSQTLHPLWKSIQRQYNKLQAQAKSKKNGQLKEQ